MFNSNKVREGLRGHDTAKIISAMGTHDCSNVEIARKFITILRQSACLVIQVQDEAKEKRRDHLVDFCRKLLSNCPGSEIIEDFENHVSDAKIVEFGYREIFNFIRDSEISKHAPAKQAWGMIQRVESEFRHIKGEIAAQLRKHAAAKKGVFDPQQLTIPSADGTGVRPDALTHGITKNIGDTLVTLAHIHKWFEKDTGIIVIPAEEAIDDSISFQAGVFTVAASQWRRLEEAWDRSRFFGAQFRRREQEFPVNNGSVQSATLIELTSAKTIELLDRIAIRRLEQAYFQSQMDFYPNEEPSGPVCNGGPSNGASPYISTSELIAGGMLRDKYHLPIDDESAAVEGLPLKAFLRGYSYYDKIAKDASGNSILSCIRISKEELEAGLISVGLTREQAAIFITLTTFGRRVADLFDAPLLKISDGSYRFFAAAFHAPVISAIILSRIACLNRQRDEAGELINDNVFEDKGRLFESRTIELLTKAGIQAHGFKYTIGGVEYDCDVAALIDETLFVFECKNRSLPMGHAPSLYYFSLTLQEAKKQVKRIASQFTKNPEIVRRHFGIDAKWSRVVPVVLNALPWSSGLSDGVYIYDASALVHLIEVGSINLVFVHKEDERTQKRRLSYPLRRGNTPTAHELEKQMEAPAQLKLNLLGWEQISRPIQASQNLVFAFPEWSKKPVTLKEQMITLGTEPKEADNIEEEITGSHGKSKFGKSAECVTSKKIGRNAPCPCGSGKKHKKCCLT